MAIVDLSEDSYTVVIAEDALSVSITELITLGSAGEGDMLQSTYDPDNIHGDSFDMDNMKEGVDSKILTQAERTTIDNIPDVSTLLDKATYDPGSVGSNVFDMDNMSEGTTGKILTQAERDKINLVNEWNIIHATSDINPAIPYTLYKVDASAGPVTVYLPDPQSGCYDEYDIELDINSHNVTITTVSGIVGSINGNDELILPSVGARLKLKCHSDEGYDIILDTRSMGTLVDISGDRDFTGDGFEDNVVYRVTPSTPGGYALLTLPEPSSYDNNRFIMASFVLVGDGSFSIVREDGGFIAGSVQQTVSTLDASITITDGMGEYELTGDSRPKAANSVIEIPAYRLDEISDIGGYYYLTSTKEDPKYGSEVEVVSPIITDASVGSPINYVSYVSQPGFQLGSFPASNTTFYVTTRKTANGGFFTDRDVRAYYELYKRTDAGVESLIIKTSEFIITEDEYSQFQISTQTDSVEFDVDDRVVLKVYLEKSATGGIDPTLTTLIEGDNGAFFAFSQPTSYLTHSQLTGRTNESQHPATSISFDNTDTGMTSVSVQDAIEEASGMQSDGTRRFGDITGENTTNIEPDGSVKYVGDATIWEDIQGSLIGRRLYATTGRIDYDYQENAMVFQDSGDITSINDCVIWNYQYPHKAKEDGSLNLHIHYEQASATDTEFTVRHRIQDTGEAKTTAWVETVVSANANNKYTYVSGTLNQICELVSIDMTGHGLSAQIQFRLTRSDNNGGTINGTFVDAHYEADTNGSREEYVK